MAVSCVVFGEAVRRRRAATTNLFEQRTESMLVVLLPGFWVASGGRDEAFLAALAFGPRRARAAAPLASRRPAELTLYNSLSLSRRTRVGFGGRRRPRVPVCVLGVPLYIFPPLF